MESAKIYPLNRNRFEGSTAGSAPASPPKPKLLDQVRQAIRRRHYSDRTEKAYVHWIKRYIFFHNKRHPQEMAEAILNGYVPMARRIHIIGSTGSGKTHVACLLSRRLSIPTFDLDDLFWDRSASTYGVRAMGDVRDRKLAEIVIGDAWIIEGVYHQWLGPSFDRAEIILALTPSVWVRDARVIRRFIKRKLGLVPSKRESVRDLWQLLQWNHNYDHDNYPRAMAFVRERNHTAATAILQMSKSTTTSSGVPYLMKHL